MSVLTEPKVSTLRAFAKQIIDRDLINNYKPAVGVDIEKWPRGVKTATVLLETIVEELDPARAKTDDEARLKFFQVYLEIEFYLLASTVKITHLANALAKYFVDLIDLLYARKTLLMKLCGSGFLIQDRPLGAEMKEAFMRNLPDAMRVSALDFRPTPTRNVGLDKALLVEKGTSMVSNLVTLYKTKEAVEISLNESYICVVCCLSMFSILDDSKRLQGIKGYEGDTSKFVEKLLILYFSLFTWIHYQGRKEQLKFESYRTNFIANVGLECQVGSEPLLPVIDVSQIAVRSSSPASAGEAPRSFVASEGRRSSTTYVGGSAPARSAAARRASTAKPGTLDPAAYVDGKAGSGVDFVPFAHRDDQQATVPAEQPAVAMGSFPSSGGRYENVGDPRSYRNVSGEKLAVRAGAATGSGGYMNVVKGQLAMERPKPAARGGQNMKRLCPIHSEEQSVAIRCREHPSEVLLLCCASPGRRPGV
jgi:hypothetical protein